jgi:hypothetical protein
VQSKSDIDPREVKNQSYRVPAEGTPGTSENTGEPHPSFFVLFLCWPSLHALTLIWPVTLFGLLLYLARQNQKKKALS